MKRQDESEDLVLIELIRNILVSYDLDDDPSDPTPARSAVRAVGKIMEIDPGRSQQDLGERKTLHEEYLRCLSLIVKAHERGDNPDGLRSASAALESAARVVSAWRVSKGLAQANLKGGTSD